MNIRYQFSSLPAILRLGPLLLAIVLLVPACSSPSGPATKTAALASGSLSDGEILEVLRTLNNGEIAQAELALMESRNAQVRDTAELILNDHTRVNERIDTIARSDIELDSSFLADGLKRQLEGVRKDLTKFSGTKFDCTYLQKQIAQHELALETVRNELQPDAKADAVKQLLNNAGPGLERHMQSARDARESIPECTES